VPELPEVETTVRLLRPRLEGRRVVDAAVHWPRTLGGQDEAQFRAAVCGARVARLWRRAKFIALDLERRRSPAGTLLCHLRMSGRLVVEAAGAELDPHVRVVLRLDRGALHFNDARKFGRFFHCADPAAFLAALGPEPLGAAFTADWLARALRARRRLLKPLLLDQSFVAGLGNIYVDEALHRAGLHPLRRSDRVPRGAARRLHAAIRATLEAAIEREGSSFDVFYRTPEGNPGRFQDQWLAYGREGEPCRRCGRAIRRIVVGQRGTHLCTRCQPAPRRGGNAQRRVASW